MMDSNAKCNDAVNGFSQGNSIASMSMTATISRPLSDVEMIKQEAQKEMEQKKRDDIKSHLKGLLKKQEKKNKEYNEMIKSLNELNKEIRDFERMNLNEAYDFVQKNKSTWSSSDWFFTQYYSVAA